jgi:hypothetical protein
LNLAIRLGLAMMHSSMVLTSTYLKRLSK